MSQQLPAFLLNRPTKGLVQTAAAGLATARPPHISRSGNKFTLVDGAGNRKPVTLMDPKTGHVYIDVVIVDANQHTSRMYFDGPWREDNPDPPACWSDNGTGPSVHATKPQSRVCAGCPKAEWGSSVSKITGKPIPACQSSKKLAVIVVGDDSDMVYEFSVPPGSFSDKEHGWLRYVNSIAGYMIGNRHADLSDVVTRISFVGTGVLSFQPASIITEDLVERIDAAWASDKTAKIVGLEDKARDPSLPIGVVHASTPAASVAPAAQLAPPPAPMLQPSQQQAEPAKRPRGRPRTEAPVPKDALHQSNPLPDAGDIPPFLQRTPQAPQHAPAPAQQFGLQQPAALPDSLEAELDKAFNLPTGGQ